MSGLTEIWQLLVPIRAKLLFACLFQALATASGMVPFLIIADLGRLFLSSETPDALDLWGFAGLAIAGLGGRLVFGVSAVSLTHLADLDLQLALKRKIAHHLSAVPLGWFTDRNAALIKKSLQDDVGALHHAVGHAFTDCVTAITGPMVALLYLMWVDWRLAVLALIPVLVGGTLFTRHMKTSGASMKEHENALTDISSAALELVQGAATLKTFNHDQDASVRFQARAQNFIAKFQQWALASAGLSAATEVALSPLAALVTVALGGMILVAADLTTVGAVLAALILGPALSAPFLAFSFAQNQIALSASAAERILAVLETPILPTPPAAISMGIPTGIDPKTATAQDQTPSRPPPAWVRYENVHFSYDGVRPVLEGINLTLAPGTVTALVGPSGSGKSTLARLLLRFWDPDQGAITLAGIPLTKMAASSLYRQIAFMFQETHLLRESLFDNIAMARPDIDREAVTQAARIAQIHDRISALPRGYDAVVGEDAHLSGGETQRVCMARALVADPDIFVFDEATAATDPESEAAIQAALPHLITGKTTLMIAHRLQTIMAADQICVLDQGRLLDCGRHEDLLQRCALYAQLWEKGDMAR